MQALEEIRRRDPVKRAIFVGIGLVGLTLVWSSSLIFEKMAAKTELANLDAQISSRSQEYRQVLDNQQALVMGRQKLNALYQLSTNRFLVGDVLDALQKSSVDNIQLTRFKIDQTYSYVEGTKSTTNQATGALVSGKPALCTEKTALTLYAKDTGANAGDSIGRFQTALSQNTLFRSLLCKTNEFRLMTALTPQSDAEGKTFVAFTLETHLPDKTR